MIKIRTRILTAEQIAKMPLHNLKRYQKSIHKSRGALEYNYKHDFTKSEFDLTGREHVVERMKLIKKLDWLSARVKEAIKGKK